MRNYLLLAVCLAFLNGCTTIVDSMTSEPFEPDPAKTGVLASLNDVKMSTFIGVNIKKADSGLDDSHVNVTTINSVVLLAGEVPSNELKLLAGNVARAYTGVRKVHNELQVRGNTTLVSRTNDSIIAAQIKTKLVFEKQVDSSQVNVIAEDGIIFLMGLTTKVNGNLAADIASGNSGVRKVVKVFEYVD